MLSFLSSLIAASTLFVASTFGGMSIFGMHATMAAMDDGGCASSTCVSTHNMDVGDAACVSHCLSAAESTTATPVPLTLALVVLVVVLISFASIISPETFPRAIERWREGIGKLLLHQHLAPVMVRD
jgi:hypothetical protein